jgi:tetratricopeptide (TPR) repeat protein
MVLQSLCLENRPALFAVAILGPDFTIEALMTHARTLLAIEISSVCFALFLNILDFAPDAWGVVNPLECLLLVAALVSGAFAWKWLQKTSRAICVVFLLIPALLLPGLLSWCWTNAIHPAHLRERQLLESAADKSMEQKDFKTAEQMYKSILQKEKSGYFQGYTWVELRLADTLENERKMKEAEQVYLSALDRYVDSNHEPEQAFASDMRVTCVQNLAIFYLQQTRYKEAEGLFKRALAMHAKNQTRSWESMLCAKDYAQLLRATGRPDEAKPLEREAKSIRDEIEGNHETHCKTTIR